MCGIIGYINNKGVRESEIQLMNDSLRHRGPDDEGIFIDSTVGFGHRRLSIIDLEAGKQPMSNEDGSIWITFNGEIYNYKDIKFKLERDHLFKTKSDTEVILHLYEEKGGKCLDYMRGMFAFAIYDFNLDKLFIARDHLGQKPLYYYYDKNSFAFASEIKSLLALKPELKEIDENALYEYLTLRIIAPPRSMFRRIKKLPPGHYLIYQNGKISVERYWDLHFEPKETGDFGSIVEELEKQVKETVRYHLVSDVPVGAFLSGGIDSSLVVAFMSQWSEGPFKTFSGDVPYKKYSEIPYTRVVSDKFKTERFEFTFTPSLVRTLPEVIWHMDEPSDPLSICMYYLSEMARKEVKVVLGGDGGDELFGGYDRYYGNVLVSYYSAIPGFLRKQIFEKLIRKIPEGFWYKSISHKLKWIHYVSFYDGGERYSKSLSYPFFSDWFSSDLYTEEFRKSTELFDPEASIKEYFNSDNAKEVVDKMLCSDSMVRMPDHPVMILDRMTMAHGLEARSPFLDHKLAEFCARIHPKHKIKGNQCRYIQIELAKKFLPSLVTKRKKQGFASPLTYLLDNEFRLLYKNFLVNSRMVEAGYFNQEAINILLEEHLNKKADHGQRLWLLCNLEMWHRMYIGGSTKEEITSEFLACM